MQHLKMSAFSVALSMSLSGAGAALADTTDVTWQNRVELAKEGAHCADDPKCFNRYHPAIPAGGDGGQARRS